MNFENGQLEKGAVQPKVMFDCTTRGRPAMQHCAARSIDRRRRVEGVGEGEGGAPKKMPHSFQRGEEEEELVVKEQMSLTGREEGGGGGGGGVGRGAEQSEELHR